jgi:glycosyltransferase involved in cell wall biosynthesis
MLLSVCIPTFNRAAFIRLSARYWLEQLAPFAARVELIIADNASADETAAVLRSYESFGNVRVIVRPHHLNFNETTYDLVANHARGDYVWVCGDDDYLNSGGLAKAVAALDAHPRQDHFYVATQFVPAHHAPDVTREDPRLSSHLCRPKGDPFNRPLAHTKEILETDDGAFSGFYSSIWRQPLALEALSGEFRRQPPFSSLEATLPYAVYIARHRLDQPCYRIGCPLLTVVHTISWPQHAAIFRLRTLPELYELFIEHGVSPRTLRRQRSELLAHWPKAVLDLRRHPGGSRQTFSFFRYFVRHACEFRFWQELAFFTWSKLFP